MAHANVERLMSNARVHLPGATDDALRLELFNVMDEFFRISKSWRETVTIDTVVNQLEYTLDSTTPSKIDTFLWAYDGNTFPVYGTMEAPGTLILRSYPTVVEPITITVSLTVSDPVDRDGYVVFPDWIMDRYREGILDGLLGRMMSQNAKPYASERLAIYHLRRFRGAISSALMQAKYANLYGAQNWRFPQTFAVRGQPTSEFRMR